MATVTTTTTTSSSTGTSSSSSTGTSSNEPVHVNVVTIDADNPWDIVSLAAIVESEPNSKLIIVPNVQNRVLNWDDYVRYLANKPVGVSDRQARLEYITEHNKRNQKIAIDNMMYAVCESLFADGRPAKDVDWYWVVPKHTLSVSLFPFDFITDASIEKISNEETVNDYFDSKYSNDDNHEHYNAVFDTVKTHSKKMKEIVDMLKAFPSSRVKVHLLAPQSYDMVKFWRANRVKKQVYDKKIRKSVGKMADGETDQLRVKSIVAAGLGIDTHFPLPVQNVHTHQMFRPFENPMLFCSNTAAVQEMFHFCDVYRTSVIFKTLSFNFTHKLNVMIAKQLILSKQKDSVLKAMLVKKFALDKSKEDRISIGNTGMTARHIMATLTTVMFSRETGAQSSDIVMQTDPKLNNSIKTVGMFAQTDTVDKNGVVYGAGAGTLLFSIKRSDDRTDKKFRNQGHWARFMEHIFDETHSSTIDLGTVTLPFKIRTSARFASIIRNIANQRSHESLVENMDVSSDTQPSSQESDNQPSSQESTMSNMDMDTTEARLKIGGVIYESASEYVTKTGKPWPPYEISPNTDTVEDGDGSGSENYGTDSDDDNDSYDESNGSGSYGSYEDEDEDTDEDTDDDSNGSKSYGSHESTIETGFSFPYYIPETSTHPTTEDVNNISRLEISTNRHPEYKYEFKVWPVMVANAPHRSKPIDIDMRTTVDINSIEESFKSRIADTLQANIENHVLSVFNKYFSN